MSDEEKKNQPADGSGPAKPTGEPPAKPAAGPPANPAAGPPAKPAAAAKPSGPPKAPDEPAPPAVSPEAEAALRAFEEEEQERAEAEEEEEQTALAARQPGPLRRFFSGFFQIRDEPSIWGKLVMVLSCIGLIFLAWYLTSRPWWGPKGNERLLDKMAMGSPEEVFGSLSSLWYDRALMRNLFASLWRVMQGFGLAILIGVPIGILCGTFKRIDAFFAPVSMFGRNVPIAALVPLTMLFFGIDEAQKVAFIFISCVAFIMFDASRAIADVNDDYLDTAYTLGASRWQVLNKVLIPLAMPDIFNSLRLLFGLAFGYIILAEMVNAEFGVGKLILVSQRRGPKEHVYLVLFFLTLVAFLINMTLSYLQRVLFSYRYGRR